MLNSDTIKKQIIETVDKCTSGNCAIKQSLESNLTLYKYHVRMEVIDELTPKTKEYEARNN